MQSTPIRILVVDDEPALCTLTKQFLDQAGDMEVDIACSAGDARKALVKQRYDVIVSDYHMPGEDGVKFLKWLRAEGSMTPFILLIEKGRPEVVIDALNNGADSYLQKGGQPNAHYEELEHRIRTAKARGSAEQSDKQAEDSPPAANEQLAAAEEELRKQIDVIVQGQSELREDAAFSESIMDSLPGIFYIYDAPSLRLVGWNRNHQEVSGYTDKEMLGKHVLDWHRLENAEAVLAAIDNCMTTGQASVEAPVVMKDGHEVQYLLTGKRLDTKARSFFMGVGVDITDRKSAEEALRVSQQIIEGIINAIPVRVFWKDKNLVYMGCNAVFARDAGFTEPKEVIGKDDYQMVWRDQAELYRGDDRHVIDSGCSRLLIEEPQKTPNGDIITLLTNKIPLRSSEGEIIGVLGTYMDITERKRAEEALRESEKRYRILVDSANEAIVVEQDGMLRLVNPMTVALTGFTEQDLISRHFLTFIHPADRTMVMDRHQKRTSGEAVPFRYAFRLVAKDGSTKWVEISAVAIDWEGRPGTLNFLTDITERKQAEDALLIANRKLNLLSSITRHDISNHITALEGHLAILERKEPQLASNDNLKKAEKAARQISDMIDFTKTYEDIGIHAPLWQNVRELVGKASEDYPLEKVRVINDVPAGTEVYADPLIVKVFHNLMQNAMRHGNGVTTIRFSLEERDGTKAIVCEDDGLGISPEMRENLFNQGFGKDHGLGLFLSREVLSITGIGITEEGEPGKGARFVMTLPIAGLKRSNT